MEEANGKQLPDNWVIHHLNPHKSDNRAENLIAIPRGNHHYALFMQGLQTRIGQLEAELRKLKSQARLERKE